MRHGGNTTVVPSKWGLTPLTAAVYFQTPRSVRELIKWGADQKAMRDYANGDFKYSVYVRKILGKPDIKRAIKWVRP